MINILPEKQKKLIRHEYWMRLLSMIMIMFIFLSIFATILILPLYFFSIAKEKFLEKKLEVFDNENSGIKIEDMSKVTEDINKKTKILDTKWKENIFVSDILKIILTVVPEKIKILQITYNENLDGVIIFKIYGKADDRAVLKDFKIILENEGHFKDVNLPVSNFVKKTNIDFSVSFSLNLIN